MAALGTSTRPILGIALLIGLVWWPSRPTSTTPAPSPVVERGAADAEAPRPSGRDLAPAEARAFLDRVMERVPPGGVGVSGYRFLAWKQDGRPTRAALGLKAVPGLDPDALIGRVLEVDSYEGRIPHVVASRSRTAVDGDPPDSVRTYQRIAVPGVAEVQHELVLVDAGTIDGYRVAFWYLLPDETAALDPEAAARSEFNVGVWLAAPGVVGYALSSWPRRADVNRFQWLSLTTGADALARRVVETTIDAMASSARR